MPVRAGRSGPPENKSPVINHTGMLMIDGARPVTAGLIFIGVGEAAAE